MNCMSGIETRRADLCPYLPYFLKPTASWLSMTAVGLTDHQDCLGYSTMWA